MHKPLLALLVAAAGPHALTAQEPPRAHDTLDMPSYQEPAAKWRDLEDGVRPDAAECARQIEQVRAEAGKPQIDPKPADPEQPLLIAAVDHRIEGCSLLVMRHDTSDLRPLPEARTQAPLLRPVN